MEKGTSQRKWKKRYWWIVCATVLACVGIGICCWFGSSKVGYSVVDVCAVFIAFVSSYISISLTLKINRLAEQNRIEEQEKINQEKLYAQMHAQAAAFPQFKIDTCIVYDLDELLQIDDDASQKVCDDVRQHEPTTQQKYLLKISSREAFPAYYKIDIQKVHLKLLTGSEVSNIDLTSEHCWVTNNEQFTFWINFDDQNDLIKKFKETVSELIPAEKCRVEIKVVFLCVNVLLEREKTPPLYCVNIDCSIKNEVSNEQMPNEQVKLEVEHRYLSRMNINEKAMA